jgi:hypothetical protein
MHSRGPKKELPPQFRRMLVDCYTKEPAGTIIIEAGPRLRHRHFVDELAPPSECVF